ncbi:MAG: Minf_1886 family protein [Maioricimonas sp. JB049]
MSVTSRSAVPRLRYHPDAYRFVFEALQFTQEQLQRPPARDPDDESAHISGQELLAGIRELALKRYGLLARSVFGHWGVRATNDFGRIVFELIERGEMRKTDRDQLSDFADVYQFDEALEGEYQINTDQAFSS